MAKNFIAIIDYVSKALQDDPELFDFFHRELAHRKEFHNAFGQLLDLQCNDEEVKDYVQGFKDMAEDGIGIGKPYNS